MRRLGTLGAFLWAVISVGLALGLCAGGRAAAGLSCFQLQTIRLEGAQRTSREAAVEAAGLTAGTSLFALDLDAVRAALEDLPWVRAASVSRRLPATLLVRVQEWQPLCLIRLDRLYYLSAEGHVIRAPLDQGLDYPVVTGLTWATLEGEGPLRRSLLESLPLTTAGLAGGELAELHADPDSGVTLYTDAGDGVGIHLGFAPFAEKLSRLARLGRHLRKRGQRAAAIDLDYEDKIVARLAGATESDSRR